MTLGKASLIALGFIGSMALGVWMAPYVTDRGTDVIDVNTSTVESATPASPARAQQNARTNRENRETTARIESVAVSSPDLHKRLKPVLTSGANMQLAADGFTSAEQFATVAYLSRNTGVPFALLKHRVLNEGRSFGDAVKVSKPDANVEIEVNRARAEARAEIWAMGRA